jgi:hypothetical protein
MISGRQVIPDQTFSVPAIVTPLWTFAQGKFPAFAESVFHFEAPVANSANVTVTVKRSKFGTNVGNSEQYTLTPGSESPPIRSGRGETLRYYSAEAQSAAGTQQLRFIGEALTW